MTRSTDHDSDGVALTAGEALAECLRCGYREAALAILRRSLEVERSSQPAPADWQTSLEDLITVCLDHSLLQGEAGVIETLDYADAVIRVDVIAEALRSGHETVRQRMLAGLVA